MFNKESIKKMVLDALLEDEDYRLALKEVLLNEPEAN